MPRGFAVVDGMFTGGVQEADVALAGLDDADQAPVISSSVRLLADSFLAPFSTMTGESLR